MDEHNFKIGDKVKVKTNYLHIFPQKTKVGKVVGFDCKYILVIYSGCPYVDGFPYQFAEVEKVNVVGQQLFDFMLKEIK